MTDIVERLLDLNISSFQVSGVMDAAANEIKDLRSEVFRLEQLLKLVNRSAIIAECARVAEDFANKGQSKADKIHAAFEIAQRIRRL